MKRFALIALFPLALLPLALAAPLAAQDDPYAACAAMADNASRLACFDTTHAGLQTTRTQQTEQQREDDFGLTGRAAERAPQRVVAEAAVAQAEAQEAEFALTAAITEAFIDGLGKRVLLLDNGQLWRETSGSTMRGSPPTPGSQAVISEGFGGAFQLRIDGRRGFIRVTRIR